MAKYRIRVEMIEGEDRESFEKNYAEGTECRGFVILAKRKGDHTCMIHGLSALDIALMIANSDEIRAAAVIANALVEAKSIERNGKMKMKLDKLFGA